MKTQDDQLKSTLNMSSCSKSSYSKKRPINRNLLHWLLIVTILVTGLAPAHYHLHHDAEVNEFTHTHKIDLHLLVHEVEAAHHEIDAPSFSAVPDNALNKKLSNQSIPLYAVITVLLLVLAISQYHFHSRQPTECFRLSRFTPHLTPLLRAPPHA